MNSRAGRIAILLLAVLYVIVLLASFFPISQSDRDEQDDGENLGSDDRARTAPDVLKGFASEPPALAKLKRGPNAWSWQAIVCYPIGLLAGIAQILISGGMGDRVAFMAWFLGAGATFRLFIYLLEQPPVERDPTSLRTRVWLAIRSSARWVGYWRPFDD
jgi:hypothetical protein